MALRLRKCHGLDAVVLVAALVYQVKIFKQKYFAIDTASGM